MQVVAGRLQNREPIAIKCIEAPPSGPSLALEPGSLLAREVQILRHCRSAYVVKFMGIAIDPGAQEVQLITERMAGGDLMRLLSGRRIPWRSRGWKLALDVARGLVYLASKRWVGSRPPRQGRAWVSPRGTPGLGLVGSWVCRPRLAW